MLLVKTSCKDTLKFCNLLRKEYFCFVNIVKVNKFDMRKLIRLMFLPVLFLLYSVSANAQVEKMKLGDSLPQFTIKSEKHGNVTPADLKGKVVLVSLFATWCPPCQKELADVNARLYPKYKGNKNFRLLVVGREHTDADLEKYNKKKNFSFPLYPDPKREVFSKFADQSIPRVYLFGKDGKLVYASSGYSAEEFQILMDRVEQELKK